VREIVQTKQFKRDLKKIASSGRYEMKDFFNVLTCLAKDEPLPTKNYDFITDSDGFTL